MLRRTALIKIIALFFVGTTDALLSHLRSSINRSLPDGVVGELSVITDKGQQCENLRPEPNGIDRRNLLFTVGGAAMALPFAPRVLAAEAPKKLTFQTLESGVQVADIIVGKDSQPSVTPNSKVNVHILGRLLGKQGWIFEDSQAAGEDPFRLDFGTGTVVTGLEEGLQGMRLGGRRRIVIPSVVGYTSRQLEPIPRDFGNRQRLYTTVMNNVRIDREREALGADLAGVVVLDVELLRFRN